MLPVILCIAFVASPVLCDELDANVLQGFQGIFYQTIGQHLQAEYDLLQPAIAKQNETMDACRAQIVTRQAECQTCAETSCRNPGNLFSNTFGAIDDWFTGAGNTFVDWQGWRDVGGLLSDVGNWFTDSFDFGSLGSGFNSAIGGMSNFFGDVGNTFTSGWHGFTNFMGNLGSDIGNTFSNWGSSIGSTFSFLGRKRRDVNGLGMSVRRLALLRHRYLAKRMEEISPGARQCMMQCSQCTPFLGDQTAMISGVCGDQILQDQATMGATMSELRELFLANVRPDQSPTPILTKIEYDSSDFKMSSLSFGNVYVTAMTPSGRVRYPSRYRYRLQSQQASAVEMAEELIERWGL